MCNRACQCTERKKEPRLRRWWIIIYKRNPPPPEGGHYSPSKLSTIRCMVCGARWRTAAKYVDEINQHGLDRMLYRERVIRS